MYLPREIDNVLIAWSQSPARKPLVLRGARQTGKTASVGHFGQHFDLFLEANLERFEDLSMVRACDSPEDLLMALQARHNIGHLPERTLLFLDEIQESPKAIQWLRFFYEDFPKLYVIAAGSLMEVRLRGTGFSFPVGRVTFRTQRPLSFFEFLRATERDVLVQAFNAEVVHRGVPRALHEQALDALREYLLVGGLPEAVARWTTERSLPAVRQVHGDLLQGFAEDIQKYGGRGATEYIEAAFESLPHHYGRRFRYESFAPGFRSQIMKTAISKLEAAQVVKRAWPTSSTDLPLRRKPKSAPKLLPLDVALVTAGPGAGVAPLMPASVRDLLDGTVAEIFAGLEILASRSNPAEILFWVRESSRATAEVDYLVPTPQGPRPVEVKSGPSGALKSLHQFLWRSGQRTAVRFYTGPVSNEIHTVAMPDGPMRYRLLSLPLYLASLAPADLALAPPG